MKSLQTDDALLYNRYAIRESNSIVKIFKNFKEKKSFKPDFGAEGEGERVCSCTSRLLDAFSRFDSLQGSMGGSCWG